MGLSGQAFFRGVAAERFCVRNSGARVVVEGVGDHGCEYMTGGRTVILGKTGRNFAAGMSGGIAYVWDVDGDFPSLCSTDMVELDGLHDKDDQKDVWELINLHYKYTGSEVAEKILNSWNVILYQFVRVMPTDYKQILDKKKKITQMEAEFGQNNRLYRVPENREQGTASGTAN